MPGTKKQPVALHTTLLEGLTVKSRADGSVHTIKANGKVAAEVCVGARKCRLNLREPVKNAPKGVTPSGKSKTWAGGGINVTADNVTAARALLSAVVAAAPPAKNAEPAAGDAPAMSSAPRRTVTRTTRRTGRKTAAA